MARNNLYPSSVTPGKPILGVKPNNWIQTTFGEILKPVKRKIPLVDEEEYHLVVARRNRGGIATRSILTGHNIKTKTQFIIRENDFLVANRQIIHGACGVVPKELDGAIVSNEYSVLNVKEGLLIDYLKYYSHTIYFQQACFQSSIGVDVEKMIFKLDQWFRVPVYLPPINEQQKIVIILSTWDETITVIERLIIAMKIRKNGLMQQLLNKKVRFPGFEGEWEAVTMGEISEYIRGLTYKSDDYSDCETPYNFITLKCIGKGGGFQKDGMKYLRNDVDEKYHVSCGDLIFANTDISREGNVVGAPILVPQLEGHKYIISMDLTKIKLNSRIDTKYLYYLMQMPTVRKYFRSRASGSTVLHLDVQGTKKLAFKVPPTIIEQQKIGEVLYSIDSEIELLSTYKNQISLQKKGLMQRLLSGEVRVKVE